MTADSLETRRQEILQRINGIRESYQTCVSDVTAEVANRGSEWSIADLLRHMMSGSYGGMLTRLLEEDNPDFGNRFDPEVAWKRATDNMLKEIDGIISKANELTNEQLGREGQRSGETIGVLDVLTLMANHYDEHLSQLKDEVRPREGLSTN